MISDHIYKITFTIPTAIPERDKATLKYACESYGHLLERNKECTFGQLADRIMDHYDYSEGSRNLAVVQCLQRWGAY